MHILVREMLKESRTEQEHLLSRSVTVGNVTDHGAMKRREDVTPAVEGT